MSEATSIKKRVDSAYLRDSIQRITKIVGEASPVLSALTGRFPNLGLVGAGLKVVEVAFNLYDMSRQSDSTAYDVFTDGDEWSAVPRAFWSHVTNEATERYQVSIDSTRSSLIAIKANVEDVQVGWTCFKDKQNEPVALYVRKQDKTRIIDVLADRFWARYSSTNLVLEPYSLTTEHVDTEEQIPTPLADTLQNRLMTYLEAGESRTILIDGLPGAGKSAAIRNALRKLEVRSIRFPLFTLVDDAQTGRRNDSTKQYVHGLRPQVLVVDDIDRMPKNYQYSLLDWLDDVHQYAITILTTNNVGKMDEALTRPGRIDDILYVPPLPLQGVKEALKHVDLSRLDDTLLTEMRSWPIAFIKEVNNRSRLFGMDVLVGELPALRARVQQSIDAYNPKETGAGVKDVDELIKQIMERAGAIGHTHTGD